MAQIIQCSEIKNIQKLTTNQENMAQSFTRLEETLKEMN
jgi:hypothetical protein